MSFKVSPGAVSSYGSVISKQADHQAEAISYLDKHVAVSVPEDSDRLIVPAENFNPAILDIVRDAMTRAETFFEDSGAALKDTADYYKETDEESAAELDATYTEGERIHVTYPGGPQNVDIRHPFEQKDPTEQLTEPAEPGGAPEAYKGLFDQGPFDGLNNLVSPSYQVRQLLIAGWGIDPVQEAADKLTGDWKEFAKSAKACESLADFYADTFVNIAQYTVLPYYWQGNAADMAMLYFVKAGMSFVNDDSVAEPLYSTQEGSVYSTPAYWGYYWALKLLGEEYKKMSSEVSALAGAIVGIISAILDDATWAIIALAGTAIMSWTGVAAALGGGFTTIMMTSIGFKILEYSDNMGKIKTAVDLFTGMDARDGSPLTSLSGLELPKPYSHPGL